MTEYNTMTDELLSCMPMRSFMVKALASIPVEIYGEKYHTDYVINNDQYALAVGYCLTPRDIWFRWSKAIELYNPGTKVDYRSLKYVSHEQKHEALR